MLCFTSGPATVIDSSYIEYLDQPPGMMDDVKAIRVIVKVIIRFCRASLLGSEYILDLATRGLRSCRNPYSRFPRLTSFPSYALNVRWIQLPSTRLCFRLLFLHFQVYARPSTAYFQTALKLKAPVLALKVFHASCPSFCITRKTVP